MPGNKNGFNLDILDINDFLVMKQRLRIVQLYNGKFAKLVKDSTAKFSC